MSAQIRTETLMDSAKGREEVSAPNLTETLVDSPGGEGTYQLHMSVKCCGFNRRVGNVSVPNLTKTHEGFTSRKGGGGEVMYQLLIS